MRAKAIVDFVEQLFDGDPVALIFVGFFVVLGLGLFLFTMKIRRDHKREDDERARRHGRKK